MFTALITALAAVLLGPLLAGNTDHAGDTIKAWRDATKDVVEDDQKKEEALALIDKTLEELEGRKATFGTAFAKYQSLNANYDATMEDYEAGIVALNKVWSEQDRWLIDRRFALQALMTPEEFTEAQNRVSAELKDKWDEMKEQQEKLLDAYIKEQKKLAEQEEESKD